jgi:hypothetical protein
MTTEPDKQADEQAAVGEQDGDESDEQAVELAELDDDFALGSLDFDGLSPTDFEAFSFDLLAESGFSNVDWRKGTPLAASPPGSGHCCSEAAARHRRPRVRGNLVRRLQAL